MSEKEPEQIMREVFELLRELEKVKVKTERPIPIVRDRQGRLANDLTLKEWLNKGHEEIMELQDTFVGLCSLDDKPNRCKGLIGPKLQDAIVGEACDVIEWVYSFMNQCGFTHEIMDGGTHKTNEKLKERGCID